MCRKPRGRNPKQRRITAHLRGGDNNLAFCRRKRETQHIGRFVLATIRAIERSRALITHKHQAQIIVPPQYRVLERIVRKPRWGSFSGVGDGDGGHVVSEIDNAMIADFGGKGWSIEKERGYRTMYVWYP